MPRFGYTLMTEQSGPKDLVAVRDARRAGRLRLRGLQRPLLAVADLPGPRPVRVDGAGRGRPGHLAGRADDLRDLPDPALPPGRGGAEGGDPAAALRRPVHPRPRVGGEPQRARHRRGLAARSTSARTCSWRRPRSSASCTPASWPPGRATTSASTPPGSGTCPRAACRSASRCPGPKSIERFAPLADHLVAVEPEAELIKAWDTGEGRPRPRARSARSRSAGARTGTRRSPRRTTSSAGSPAAGPSTPTCRPRRGSRERASSSAPRTSPSRSPAAPTSTRSSRPSSRTGRPASPTSRWSRSGDEGQSEFLDAGRRAAAGDPALALTGRVSARDLGSAEPGSA